MEQSLSLCSAAGFALPPGDDGRLAVELPAVPVERPGEPYVVVHPGASVAARQLPPAPTAGAVRHLTAQGRRVVVTGGPGEAHLTATVAAAGAPDLVEDLTGTTDLAGLGHLLAGADAVVCGNTGPAHLAAAVGTPVVEAFAPVVPAHRWRPWGVPHVLLGHQDIACAGCRARVCPHAGQPCLASFTAEAVVAAVGRLAPRTTPTLQEALR